MSSFRVIALKDISMVVPGDNIARIIVESLTKMEMTPETGDILVIAHTIISRANNRIRNLLKIEASERSKEIAKITQKDPRLIQLIIDEASEILGIRSGLIITRHKQGFISANSGIDQSNVSPSEDDVLLLPEFPDKEAEKIGNFLENEYKLEDIGIVISDTMGRALRRGVSNVSIGAYKVPGVYNLTGKLDLYDYTLKHTSISPADSIAAITDLIMGQADEGFPVILIRGINWKENYPSSDEDNNIDFSKPLNQIPNFQSLPNAAIPRPKSEMLFNISSQYSLEANNLEKE